MSRGSCIASGFFDRMVFSSVVLLPMVCFRLFLAVPEASATLFFTQLPGGMQRLEVIDGPKRRVYQFSPDLLSVSRIKSITVEEASIFHPKLLVTKDSRGKDRHTLIDRNCFRIKTNDGEYCLIERLARWGQPYHIELIHKQAETLWIIPAERGELLLCDPSSTGDNAEQKELPVSLETEFLLYTPHVQKILKQLKNRCCEEDEGSIHSLLNWVGFENLPLKVKIGLAREFMKTRLSGILYGLTSPMVKAIEAFIKKKTES